jgi:hypothetical protein
MAIALRSAWEKNWHNFLAHDDYYLRRQLPEKWGDSVLYKKIKYILRGLTTQRKKYDILTAI